MLDDLHLELNEGPSNFDMRHNFVVSGRAVIPRTGGLNVSWVARALSGSPFTLIDSRIDPDRNGTFAEPLAAGTYSGTPPAGFTAYTVEELQGRAQRRLRPGLLQRRRAGQLRGPGSARAGSRSSPTSST